MIKQLFATLCLVFALTAPALAGDRVVAVVNDSVITKLDLDTRLQLTLRTLNTQLTPAQRQALLNQTLQQLVNEEIVRQYAARNGLNISKEMLNARIKQLEKQFKLSPGSFTKQLGGLSDSAMNQVRDSIYKDMIIGRAIAPRVSVTSDEVELLLQNLLQQSNFKEYDLAQIFLGLDSEGRSPEETSALAQDLYSQLKNGADFATLAKTYSEDGNAQQGGRLGWLSLSELSTDMQRVVRDMQPGTFSTPIASPQGWHLVYLQAVQSADRPEKKQLREVNLIQLLVSADTPEATEKLTNDLNRIRNRINQPSDLERLVKAAADKPTHAGSHLRQWTTAADLAGPFAEAVSKLPVGEVSPVITTNNKLALLFIAEERIKENDQVQVYRERIRNHLQTTRADRQARRFFRNLRRQAYVDIRL